MYGVGYRNIQRVFHQANMVYHDGQEIYYLYFLDHLHVGKST